MKGFLVLGSVAATALVLAVPALAGGGQGLGPPGGTIWAFDHTYKTIGTPTSLPGTGPTDTLYMFPDCPTCTAVSDAAPGHPDYNGGRWKVVNATGITTQPTTPPMSSPRPAAWR